MNSINHTLSTPVLFLVFNRLDKAARVFEQIQKAKPQKLYIAADGPREFLSNEIINVQAVRDYVLSNINWECEVKTLFQQRNLGCKMAVSGAIDWFFTHEDMGIILEDDCLPSRSFFRYCQELLVYYKDSPEIFHINGNNFGCKQSQFKEDYCFCSYPQVWGWATWKRAWQHYDRHLDSFDENRIYPFKITLGWTDEVYNIQMKKWKQTKSGEIDTWDFQWHFSVFLNSGKCIVPCKNQISNIGFDEQATHTRVNDLYKNNLRTEEMSFPLTHPAEISVHTNINSVYKSMMIKKTLGQRLTNRLRQLFYRNRIT